MRSSYCDKTGLKRGAWTPDEDRKLSDYIKRYGNWNWRELPKFAGLTRCGKSCRLRWMNYLRPNIKRGNYTREEEEIIINLRETLGNRWSAIAAKLPGRTDNEIKNHWHTHLKKRLQKTLTPRKEAIRQSIELPRKCESESEPNTSLDNSSGPSILESSSVVSMSHEKTTCDDTSTLTTYDVTSFPADMKSVITKTPMSDENITIDDVFSGDSMSHEKTTCDDTSTLTTYDVTSFPADMKSVITKTPMSDENITIDDVFSGDFWTEPFQMVGYNSANNFTCSQVDPELVFPPSPAYSFYSDYDMDFYFNHLPVLEEELPILF